MITFKVSFVRIQDASEPANPNLESLDVLDIPSGMDRYFPFYLDVLGIENDETSPYQSSSDSDTTRSLTNASLLSYPLFSPQIDIIRTENYDAISSKR